jgi:hypothetical protein
MHARHYVRPSRPLKPKGKVPAGSGAIDVSMTKGQTGSPKVWAFRYPHRQLAAYSIHVSGREEVSRNLPARRGPSVTKPGTGSLGQGGKLQATLPARRGPNTKTCR